MAVKFSYKRPSDPAYSGQFILDDEGEYEGYLVSKTAPGLAFVRLTNTPEGNVTVAVPAEMVVEAKPGGLTDEAEGT